MSHAHIALAQAITILVAIVLAVIVAWGLSLVIHDVTILMFAAFLSGIPIGVVTGHILFVLEQERRRY